MPDSIDQSKVRLTLDKLVDVLKDGHQGFLEFEKHLKHPEARKFFLEETQVRANFAGELENELHRLGEKDVKQSGLIAGKVHRAWGELKANLGGGDHTLLVSTVQGEEAALKAYETALDQHLPSDVKDVLTTQQAHIQKSHAAIVALRDATK